MSNNQSDIINIPKFNLNHIKNLSEDEDNDSLKLIKNKKYIDINENNKDNREQIQTELSTMISSSDSNSEESLDINQNNKLSSPMIIQEQNNFGSSLLYGNSINDLTPKRIGRLFAFFYINEKPLILIGPDCKKNIIIIYNIFIFR